LIPRGGYENVRGVGIEAGCSTGDEKCPWGIGGDERRAVVDEEHALVHSEVESISRLVGRRVRDVAGCRAAESIRAGIAATIARDARSRDPHAGGNCYEGAITET
jgi:hypothetical protein